MNYPTALFDAIGIQSAPGNRPVGTGGGFPDETSNLVGASICVNKKSKNGWVGNFANRPIQDNQFKNVHEFDPTKGVPLSKAVPIGNVMDVVSGIHPPHPEPGNDAMVQVLKVLSFQDLGDDVSGKLTAEQIKYLADKGKPHEMKSKDSAFDLIHDYSDALHANNKAKMIRNAISQGFTEKEANDAYNKMRDQEALTALRKAENPSQQLYDLIDSRGSGVDKREPGNNESAYNLAMGGVGNPRVTAESSVRGGKKYRSRSGSVASSVMTRGTDPREMESIAEVEELMRENRIQTTLESYFPFPKK